MEKYAAIVNIASPLPIGYCGVEKGGIYDNETQINYIEPLREAGKVNISDAYSFNKNQFDKGESPCVRPGFLYMFWFYDLDEAVKFKDRFKGELQIVGEPAINKSFERVLEKLKEAA